MDQPLSVLNPHPKKIPGPTLLHELVANGTSERALLAIDYLSSDGTRETLTYEDLNGRSNALALRLSTLFETSAPSSNLIPLFVQQCPELYVAELATLKAGAAFVPMPIDAPEERIRFICRDIEAKILITTSQLQDKLPALEDVTILVLDGESLGFQHEPPVLSIDPSQPAYVMYTSGSTGLPKGVILSHSAVTQALLAHDQHMPRFSRFLQFASPTFDVSVFEIFFPLYRSATLVCGDRRGVLTDLPGFINHMDVDAAELTPSVASSLLRYRRNVPGLNLLLTIGEMLKRDVVEEFGGSAEVDSILYGMYGPTEATIHCTLQPSFSDDMSVRNIGIPLDSVSAFVVQPKAEGDPVTTVSHILPIGEEGELAIGGHQLADCYLNRPEQTEAAFFVHPDHGRLYRTGDRAKMTESGGLECLGRITGGQVKLRGQRIELGEVEYAASRTPGCETAVADVLENALAVFCVCPKRRITQSEVLEVCRQWLPGFMVPAEVLILKELPYLDSGKVDRKALSEVYAREKSSKSESQENLSIRMREVIDTTSRILQVTVADHTSLSAAGLDSLTSIRLASEFRRLGVAQLDATDVLGCRHVGDIDALIDHAERNAEHTVAEASLGDIRADLREAVQGQTDFITDLNAISEYFPASPVQSAMLSETARDGRLYCNWVEIEIPFPCSPQDVERSLADLAQQHSLLRAGFVAVQGLPVSHAVVIWKGLKHDQIQIVDSFDRVFRIADDIDLLHPCSFQIASMDGSLHVGIAIHHALYDQWSMDVLRTDLATLLKGGSLDPPPSFASITAQDISYAGSNHATNDLNFWRGCLMDFSPTLLPSMSGKNRPKHQDRTTWRELDLDLSDFRSKTRDLGYTPATIFQSTMAYLLGLLTGNQDVTYGVVYSGRHLAVAGIERMFGPCLRSLPLRVELDDDHTCLDLLQSVHDTNRAVQNHALAPLAEIKSSVESAQGSALFDVLFIWQESTIDDLDQSGALQEIDSTDQHEFNLVLELAPVQGSVKARVTYESSRINSEQVNIFLRQLASVTRAMLDRPSNTIMQLATCMPDDILSISNPSPSACADGKSLLGNLQSFAHSRPSAPALCFASGIDGASIRSKTVSYSEFNAKSDNLASLFRTLGALPAELLCVCMEKSANLYLAIVAALKAGCGYLPLLPEIPPERIRTILEQSNVGICICDNESVAVFRGIEDRHLRIINVDQLDMAAADPIPLPGIRNEDVAYTVFTSGSTGQPKGVSVTAANLLGNLQALSQIYNTKPGDRLLQACSQAFDVSVFEIFFSFYTGMCLCAAPKDVLFQDFEASINAFRVTHLSLTPTVAALIEPSNVPTVKFLVTAGEGVTPRVHQRWAGKGLHQGYGPSETTNICTANMDLQRADSLGNIGKPLSNTSAFVISPGAPFRILPTGATGEFAFGGEQVFQGYLGRADLNAECMIDHSRFGRIYRSGDMGRILPDGSLLISGRSDDQVKIRGNRIELGEINAVLMRSPVVRDCATIVSGGSSNEQSLAAFVVPVGQDEAHSNITKVMEIDDEMLDSLFEQLETSLPAYMVPARLLPISHLPLTSQGKLDRRTLKALLANISSETGWSFGVQSGYNAVDTWSDVEKGIAAALADVLKVPLDSVAPQTNLFAVGLNSLSAIILAKQLQHELKVQVKVSQILRSSTVRRLGKTIVEMHTASRAESRAYVQELLAAELVQSVKDKLELGQDTIQSILPLTPLQLAMLGPGLTRSSPTYYNSTKLRLSGNVNRLSECWDVMIARHSILRTTFVATEDRIHPYVQVVLKSRPQDGLRKGSAQINGHTDDTSKVDSVYPFQIETHGGPIPTLTLHMHHAIYDGTSLSLLLSEVESLYRGEALPPPISPEPFLMEVQRHNGEAAMSFWSRHIASFVPMPFPKSNNISSSASRTVRKRLPSISSSVQTFATRHGLSPLSVWQTALAKTLAACQGAQRQDLCFGNVVSGRSVAVDAMERLVFPTFNTIPVRVDLSRPTSYLECAQRLHQHNIEALDFQLTPLRRIQALSKSPDKHLFDALLLLQPEHRKLDETVWTFDSETGTMDLPLVLEIEPTADDYHVTLHFQPSTIPEYQAEIILQNLINSLRSIVAYPYRMLSTGDELDDSPLLGILAPNGLVNGTSNGSDEREENGSPSEQEQIVREAFANLAGVSKGSIQGNTSMYQIGLDSLNAAQIAARLRASNVDVDATDVMEALTPRALASLVRKKGPTRRSTPAPSVISLDAFDQQHRAAISRQSDRPEADFEAIRPCTPTQIGMIAQSVQSDGRLYINHITYKVPSATTRNDVLQAWRAVIERHQVLRMGFHQMQDSTAPYALAILEPSSASIPMREAKESEIMDDIEAAAVRHIMESLTTQAWCITLLRSVEEVIMTLSIHHALYDATSLQLICSDLASAARKSTLGPAPVIDEVLSSTLQAGRDVHGHAAKYWTDTLKAASISPFPNLTPTVVESGKLEVVNRSLTTSTSTVEDFCRKSHATVQAIGQTAWAILLSAYTGSSDVTFGTVISGHPTSDNHSVAFPSVTTIPVPCRVDCAANDVLQKMVKLNSQSHRHRFYPLSDIQRCGGHGGQQLFDTVFVYHKTAATSHSLDWPVVRETAAVDYSVSLELESNAAGCFDTCLTFDTSRVPHEHALLLLRQFEHTLTSIVGSRSAVPDAIHSISPAKEDYLSSPASHLHELFEHTASKHPERTALEFVSQSPTGSISTRTWTYGQFEERANQVAHVLRRAGVPSHSVVAVRMDKCPEASFAFLGILKAGCSFLAMDPALPMQRQSFILQDSGARLLLLSGMEEQPVPDVDVPCLRLSEKLLQTLSSERLIVRGLSGADTCYCLYTSGTTGTPKGCEITHENAVQAMMSFQRLFAGRWTDRSRWLQFASYWFDVSILEHFWSWSVGITVVGAPRDFVLEDIPGFINKLGITHIDLTPSLARLVHPDDVPSLCGGVFITGGEALKQEIIDVWGSQTTICNGYGPTETTIGVTMNRFIGPDAKSSNIGKQFDNVGTYVLNPDNDEPVLMGAVGELCIAGVLVGKGYLNRQELTDTLFPYNNRLGQRIYRTGDLVRMLADQSFSFIGRKDTQAKLRGQRLEVSEIDNVIRASNKGIQHVVSEVVKAQNTGKETLVSFITTNAAGRTDVLSTVHSKAQQDLTRQVSQACTQHLPGYMVPTHILPINYLPLTVNNKVDSKRLVQLFHSCSLRELQTLQGASGADRSLTAVEQRIAQCLSEILKMDLPADLTPQSNIFSLGLSSISVIPFVALLKRNGFGGANVADVMKNPVLSQLSTAISGAAGKSSRDASLIQQTKLSLSAYSQRYKGVAAQTLGLQVEDLELVARTTPLQHGLIFESLRDGKQPYLNHFYYSIKENDIERLLHALQMLVDAVQILRTRFVESEGGYTQAILKRVDSLPVKRETCNTHALDAVLLRAKDDWLATNRDTLNVPWEVLVVDTPNRSVMALHIHHALYDGISLELLLGQLAQIYRGEENVYTTPSFSEALAYGPLSSGNAKPFWTDYLGRFFYNSLRPVDEKPVVDRSPKVELRLMDCSHIEESRRQLGVSHQAIVQACFEVALRIGTPSIEAYGMVVSGRSIDLDGADRVLGPMFNTIPTTLDESMASSTLANHIRQRHQMNVAMLPYQHTSLREIRKWCCEDPSGSMFDVLFVFQHDSQSIRAAWKDMLEPINTEPQAEYPLACEIEMNDNGGMTATFLAQADYFDQAAVQKICHAFEGVLNKLSSDKSLGEEFGITTLVEHDTNGHVNGTQPQTNGVGEFEWTPEAEKIRDVAADVSGVNAGDINEHTTIFTLGMDSIDAVKLSSRLKKAGLALPVSKILKAQTIPKMLGAMQANKTNGIVQAGKSRLQTLDQQLQDEVLPLLQNASNVEQLLPATPQQEGLVADMLQSELREYFNHDVLKLEPGTDLRRLETAWQTIVDGSPILRTSFVEITNPDVDAVYAQIVHGKHEVQIAHEQIGSVDTLQDVYETIRLDVFQDTLHSPPLRLTVLDSETEHYLVLSIAHALYDGQSLALLHEDVKRAYYNAYTERPSYEDIIDAALEANSRDAQQFWAGLLSGARPQSLPIGASQEDTGRVHRVERKVGLDITTVRDFCRSSSITIQAVAQTCWALTLAHYTKSIEVLFGVVMACRDMDDAEEIMFPMMNTVAVRSFLHGSRKDMLRYMQDMMTEMRPYQKTPLRSINAAAAVGVEKSIGGQHGAGLFDTLFIYQRRQTPRKLLAAQIYQSIGGSSDVEYPVAVEIEDGGKSLLLRTACKDTVMDEAGTAQMLADMEQVLDAIINAPEMPTVAFEAGRVSICGLRSFKLKSSDAAAGQASEPASPTITAFEEECATVQPILQTLAQVAKVPLDQLNATTSIESIGIDSISAIKVAGLLRKQEIGISVSELLSARNAAQMARVVKTKSEPQPDSKTKVSSDEIIRQVLEHLDIDSIIKRSNLDKDNVELALPSTAGQVYMLSMSHHTRGQLFYSTFKYQLGPDGVTFAQIQQAWKALVAKHPILRTIFVSTDNEHIPVLQVILRHGPDDVRRHDNVVDRYTTQPMVPLDVQKGENVYAFSLRIHHALYDAVSLPLLMQDFNPLIAGHTTESTQQGAITYSDFLAPQITPEAYATRKDFWTDYLNSTQPDQLLKLRQPPFTGPQHRVELFEPALSSSAYALEVVARREGISTQSLLFAAWARVYASYATSLGHTKMYKDGDVVLGIYLASRSHLPDLSSLVAPTVNMVPLLIRSPASTSLVESAKQVHQDLQRIGGMVESSVGLWETWQWTGVKVDCFVNLLRLPEGNDGEFGRETALKEVDRGQTRRRRDVVEAGEEVPIPTELEGLNVIGDAFQHSLDVEMAVLDGRIDVGIFASETMVSLEGATEMLEEFKGLLEKLVGKAKA